MQYQSTRDKNLKASSAQAILNGLAPDGGLYTMPSFDEVKFDYTTVLNMDTMSMSTKILSKLLPDFSEAEMAKLVHDGYTGKFETDHLTPTVPVGEDFILELFRGPTSAFKDVALSMLPRLMTASKEKLGVDDEIMILTATSGDTGKAAMEGFCDVPGTKIIVFYPHGGVSAVQQAQMATQAGRKSSPPSARISCSRVRAFACPRPTPSTSAASPRRSSIIIERTPTSCRRAASSRATRSTTSCRPATSAISSRATLPRRWAFPSASSCARPTPTMC